jgi:hypothetical protein
VTSRRLAAMLLVPFLVVACHQDPPTPDLLVYAVNRDGVTVTVLADGVAQAVPPCGLYRQGFFGTGGHELQVKTPSGTRSTPLDSVRGSYRTVWYLVGASGIADSTQSEVNAVLAACKAAGTPSP